MFNRIAAIFWWLGISLYLGGLATLGLVAAPSIFATVRTTATTLPGMLPWMPAEEATNQLGGELFGNILQRFHSVERLCLVMMAGALIIALFSHRSLNLWIRVIALSLIAAIVSYEGKTLIPQVWQKRQELRDAPTTQIADAKRPAFESLHDRATNLGKTKVFLLVGLVGLSAATTTAPRKKHAQPQPETA